MPATPSRQVHWQPAPLGGTQGVFHWRKLCPARNWR